MGRRSPHPRPRWRPAPAAMALDLAVRGSAALKAELQTLAPLAYAAGPPPPPPISPTSGMYLPGPPPPGVLLPRTIPYPLDHEYVPLMDECRSRSLMKVIFCTSQSVRAISYHVISCGCVANFGSWCFTRLVHFGRRGCAFSRGRAEEGAGGTRARRGKMS
jgi:hypothetical protein